MKITIKDIHSRGLELAADIEPMTIGLEDSQCKCLSKLSVRGLAQKVESTVLVHVDVTAKFLYTCSRCLEAFEKDVLKEMDFDYAVNNSMRTIDVGDDIRQEMIMEEPIKILCRENCKGICTKCGVNLNIEKCKCN